MRQAIYNLQKLSRKPTKIAFYHSSSGFCSNCCTVVPKSAFFGNENSCSIRVSAEAPRLIQLGLRLSALLRWDSVMLEPSKLAPKMFAPLKSAPLTLVSLKSALRRLAPRSFTFLSEAPHRTVPSRSAFTMRDPSIMALVRLANRREAWDKCPDTIWALTSHALSSVASNREAQSSTADSRRAAYKFAEVSLAPFILALVINVYERFARDIRALWSVALRKTDSDRFASSRNALSNDAPEKLVRMHWAINKPAYLRLLR